MIHKELASIGKTDLEWLIQDKIPEGMTIDYKSEIGDRIANDIVSFANTIGGDLILGIVEDCDSAGTKLGYPGKLVGLNLPLEKVKEKIENKLSDSVQPRLPQVEIHEVDGFDRGSIFVVRIPESSNKPHLVVSGKQMSCYKRNSFGKFPLAPEELRNEFLSSRSMLQRFYEFSGGRLRGHLDNTTPIAFTSRLPRVVLHIASIKGLEEDWAITPREILPRRREIACLSQGISQTYVDADGFTGLSFVQMAVQESALITWQGHIELTSAALVDEQAGFGPTFRSPLVFSAVVNAITRYQALLVHLGLEEDIFVGLSLVHAKKVLLADSIDNRMRGNPRPFLRDSIVGPSVRIKSLMESSEIASAMRPAFEYFLFSGGQMSTEKYFAEDGRYVERLNY